MAGFLTFVFDDERVTDYTLMLPLFQSKGVLGCSAVAYGNLGLDGGSLTSAQVMELAGLGWEIVSHGTYHKHLTYWNDEQLRNDLQVSKDGIGELTGTAAKNLAYPYGDSDARVRQIASEYYECARGITNGTNPPQGEDYLTNRYNLRAYGIDIPTQEYQDWFISVIDLAKSTNRWIIFYAHTTDAADVTNIGTLIDYALAEGLTIGTMSEGLSWCLNLYDDPLITDEAYRSIPLRYGVQKFGSAGTAVIYDDRKMLQIPKKVDPNEGKQKLNKNQSDWTP